MVRERLGPDAVILSNRVTSGGVEMTAVADEPAPADLSHASQSVAVTSQDGQNGARNGEPNRQPSTGISQSGVRPSPFMGTGSGIAMRNAYGMRPGSAAGAAEPRQHDQDVQDVQDDAAEERRMQERRQQERRELLNRAIPPRESTRVSDVSHTPERVSAADMPRIAPVAEVPALPVAPAVSMPLPSPGTLPFPAEEMALVREIRQMRGRLEDQIAGLNWQEQQRRDPLRSHLQHLLLGAGFSSQFSRALLETLPSGLNPDTAGLWLRRELARRLPVLASEDAMLDAGGVYALVGPTGAGKTTTTAKLAARCVMRFGPDNLALITTDSYRIGAVQQLQIYGQILGVSVHAVSDTQDLSRVLEELRGKHMILIDTVGKSQRDQSVSGQIAMLNGAGAPVKRLLLLNAVSHGDTLNEVVEAYRKPELGSDLAGCIFSKMDEATHPGSLVDIAIRHQLPVYYLSTGQKVPENLQACERVPLIDSLFRARSATALFVPGEADLQQKSDFQKDQEAAAALRLAQDRHAEESVLAGRLRIQCARLIGMLAQDASTLGVHSQRLQQHMPAFAAGHQLWNMRHDASAGAVQLNRILAESARVAATGRKCLLAVPGRTTVTSQSSGDSYTLHSTLLADGMTCEPVCVPAWSLSTAGGANARQIRAKNQLHLEKNMAVLATAQLGLPVIHLLDQLPEPDHMEALGRARTLWIARARASQIVTVWDTGGPDGARRTTTLIRLAAELDYGGSQPAFGQHKAAVVRLAQVSIQLRHGLGESGAPVNLLCVIERIFDQETDVLLSQNFLLASKEAEPFGEACLASWHARREHLDGYFRLQRRVMDQLGGCGEPGDAEMLRRFPLMLQIALLSWTLVQSDTEWAQASAAYLERMAGRPVRRSPAALSASVRATVLAEGVQRMFALLEALGEEEADQFEARERRVAAMASTPGNPSFNA